MADEDVYPASLLNAWKSSRLVYRAIEEDEADKAFIYEVMNGDPVAIAMGSIRPVAPANHLSALSFYQMTKDNPLRVLICLPATATNDDDDEKQKITEGKEKAEADKKPSPPKPTPIGMVTLFWPKGQQFQHTRDVNLGISLVGGYRGKGYGAEAINWALDWGFRWGGYHRIGLTTFSYNTRAIRVYKSLGFVEEGRIRENLYYDRKRYDEILFGMLVGEWEGLRGVGEGAREKVEEG